MLKCHAELFLLVSTFENGYVLYNCCATLCATEKVFSFFSI